MASHTLEGYLSLLKHRETRTLLVEGRDDRRAVARVLVDMEEGGVIAADEVVLDAAESIRAEGAGFGNRELVEYIHRVAREEGGCCGALVDRELRLFSSDPLADELDDHHVLQDSLFWTRGHSTENYFFEPDYVFSYLRAYHPEETSTTAFPTITESFPTILQWSGAVTLALAEALLVSRCRGICDESYWKFSSSHQIVFDLDRFCQGLVKRHAAPERVLTVKSRASEYFSRFGRLHNAELPRWISHGHLGSEMLWSAVGAIMKVHGAEQTVCHGVACGSPEQKMRFVADRWAQRIENGTAVSPTQLWEWVRSGC